MDRAVAAIDAQSYPADRMEIVVVDGGSSDGTLERVRSWMARDGRVRLLGGADVNTPLAMNIGIDASSGPFVAKIDGHGWIDRDFVKVAVEHLVAHSSVGCIGGRIVPLAETPAERASAYARFSRLGVGGGIYTAPAVLHAADTVQCGVYRREALIEAGGFDPRMAYGEDEELNYRVRQGGWAIVFHPGMAFNYRVRPTVRSLFCQYFRYGRARVAVIRKHPNFFRRKHAVPAAALVSLVCGALLALSNTSPAVGFGVLAAYGALIVGGALRLAVRNHYFRADLIAGSLVALHFGYGLGSLIGLFDGSTPQGGPSTEEHHNGER